MFLLLIKLEILAIELETLNTFHRIHNKGCLIPFTVNSTKFIILIFFFMFNQIIDLGETKIYIFLLVMQSNLEYVRNFEIFQTNTPFVF